MFFGPLLHEVQISKSSELSILCLSTGNFEGIGKLRIQEMKKCGKVFGIPEKRITIIDHFLLQDSMQNEWPLELIEGIVSEHIQQIKPQMVSCFTKIPSFFVFIVW
jgi:N-acetylglucosaminylphosphatidylinositol deacetylase